MEAACVSIRVCVRVCAEACSNFERAKLYVRLKMCSVLITWLGVLSKVCSVLGVGWGWASWLGRRKKGCRKQGDGERLRA